MCSLPRVGEAAATTRSAAQSSDPEQWGHAGAQPFAWPEPPAVMHGPHCGHKE